MEFDTENGIDSEVVRDLAFGAAKIEKIAAADLPSGTEGLVVYKTVPGCDLKTLDLRSYMPNPTRLREKLAFDDLSSFIAYVTEFQNDKATKIFFNQGDTLFTAIMDYSTPEQPKWGQHLATLKPRYSESFMVWWEKNNKDFEQLDFGTFIEENRMDVVVPDGATLLEMALNFEATKNTTFKSGHRLKDGGIQLQHTEEIKTGELIIPDSITLHIPIFDGMPAQDITLRFRFRINDGLRLRFEFERPRALLQNARDEIVAAVRTATSLPVLYGTRAALQA